MTRDEIVERVAAAAYDAHYCNHWHTTGTLCGACAEDRRADCFELSSGGVETSEMIDEWMASAEAAVSTIERCLGIKLDGHMKTPGAG